MNAIARLLLVAPAWACLAWAPPLGAQSPAGPKETATKAATGHDFEAQKVHKLGTLNADFLCERLFDSANPAAMTMELARIMGPSLLLGKVPELGAVITPEQKKTFASLRVLARQKVWMPVAAEQKVGEWLDQKYRKEGLIAEPDGLARNLRPRFAQAQALLTGLVAQLPPDNPYTFKLAVTEESESNAYVSPGGFVYVTKGLLQDKALDRNDIALRLAHEVAHLTRRHALKEYQVKAIDAMEISKTLRPMLDIARDPVKGMETLFGTMTATQLMFQRFDQVQELEGDACGTYLLARMPGVDAKAAVQRFVNERQGTASEKGWGASHPAPEERELVMTAQIDPAKRARVAQLKTGATATAEAPGKTPAIATQSTNLDQLPPTSAGVAEPQQGKANPLGGLLSRVKRALPSGAASAASAAQVDESRQ